MSIRLATIADVERLESYALEERIAFVTPLQALRSQAERDGTRTCLHLWRPSGGVSWSRSKVVAAASGLAAWFAARVERPVVAIALPNVPEAVVATLAAMEYGVAFPVNAALSPSDLAQLVESARANILVHAAPTLDLPCASAAAELLSRCPGLKASVAVGGVVPSARSIAWEDAVEAVTPRRQRRLSEVAAYFHTGGTTGRPKIAQLTLSNIAFTAWLNSVVMELNAGSTVLNGLPLFHVTGMFVNSLSPLAAGGRVVITGPSGYRSPGTLDAFYALLEAWRVTTFTAVPTIFDALNERSGGSCDLSSVRHATCGAAMAPPKVLDTFERRTGIPVLEGYGLTEATVSCARNPRDGENRRGTVGLRHPYVDLRVGAAPFTGDAGRIGEGPLWVRGPNVFEGYLGDGDEDVLVDGWLNTGDLARIESDGYVTITGRAKDVIVRGGHNIDPRSIESALADHPRVREVAAVGMIDARVGERPVAFAVGLGDPADLSTVLLEHANRTVGERAARPSEVFIVTELPRTAVGKIHKPTLRAWAAQTALDRTMRSAVGDAGRIQSMEATAAGRLRAVVRIGDAPADAIVRLRDAIGRFAGLDVEIVEVKE